MFYLLAAESGEGSFFSQYGIWIMLGVLLVLMIVMTVIPNKKRQKKAQEMMNSIRVGTKVKTIGGFVGEIKAINSERNEFVVDLSANGDGSMLATIDKAAVYTVLNPVTVAPETVAAADDLAQDAKVEEKAADKEAKKKAKRGKKSKDNTPVDVTAMALDDAEAELAKEAKKADDVIFENVDAEPAKADNDKQDENPEL